MNDSAPPIPKLTDVARLAGVGNATVSRVLNGGRNVSPETRRRITAAIDQLSYRPNRVARSLKGASSGIIGMIVPSISDLFFAKCAESVQGAVRERGAVLVVVTSHDQDDVVLGSVRQLLLHNIDGLVVAYNKQLTPEVEAALRAARVPIVGIDAPLGSTGAPAVVCDNFEGARLATEHLLAHRYPTVISVQVKPSLYTMRERLRGYRHAIAQTAIEPIQAVIDDRESAARMIEQHLRHDGEPIALFAGNNLAARYICEAVHSMRVSIPRQVALLSFDDFDLADALPSPMSVIQQPLEAIGRVAAELLFKGMAQTAEDPPPEPGRLILLPPRLILRESCGCAASS